MSLPAGNVCKVEGTMDKCRSACDINILTEWNQVVAGGVSCRTRGRFDEMALRSRRWRSNVGQAVVLKPIALVDSIVAHVVGVDDEKFSKKFTILQSSRVKPHCILENNSNEAPFTNPGTQNLP